MNTSRDHFGRTSLKVGMAFFGVTCLGAAVLAAPLSITPRNKVAPTEQSRTSLSPLAEGPAFTLAKATDGADEDCVRVTKMTGPDGRVYPTMGMVCR